MKGIITAVAIAFVLSLQPVNACEERLRFPILNDRVKMSNPSVARGELSEESMSNLLTWAPADFTGNPDEGHVYVDPRKSIVLLMLVEDGCVIHVETLARDNINGMISTRRKNY